MTRLTIYSLLPAALVFSTVCWGATIYQFQSFQACPGCSTQTGGINDAGVAGADTPGQGYLYDSKTGVSTAVPGALAVTVPGNNGRTPGASAGPGGTFVPFIREADGSSNSYPGYPGAPLTFLLELNQSGVGVGYSTLDFANFFGYLRSPTGTYTQLIYPDALSFGTFALGINQGGTVVGYTANFTENQFAGFLRASNGVWQPFNIPGAISTIPFAINDLGVVAGGYQDLRGWHGFVSMDGTVQTVDYPGAPNTNITGINNLGVLVGNSFDSSRPLAGPFTGFIATPTPEPAWMGAAGCLLVFLCGAVRKIGQ